MNEDVNPTRLVIGPRATAADEMVDRASPPAQVRTWLTRFDVELSYRERTTPAWLLEECQLRKQNNESKEGTYGEVLHLNR